MGNKKFLISALFLICLNCSVVLADNNQLNEKPLTNVKKEEIFLEESSEKGLETLEFNRENVESRERNIVPILDLKGGVIKDEPEKQQTRFESWITGDYMTGDWGGLRSNWKTME